MKSIQFIGPFSENQTLDLGSSSAINYIQIGVECPHRPPLSELFISPTVAKSQEIILSISGVDYALGPSDILEFENLSIIPSQTSSVIRVKKANDPYLIIDVAYDYR